MRGRGSAQQPRSRRRSGVGCPGRGRYHIGGRHLQRGVVAGRRLEPGEIPRSRGVLSLAPRDVRERSDRDNCSCHAPGVAGLCVYARREIMRFKRGIASSSRTARHGRSPLRQAPHYEGSARSLGEFSLADSQAAGVVRSAGGRSGDGQSGRLGRHNTSPPPSIRAAITTPTAQRSGPVRLTERTTTRKRPSSFGRGARRSETPGVRTTTVTVRRVTKPRPSTMRGERSTTLSVGVDAAVASCVVIEIDASATSTTTRRMVAVCHARGARVGRRCIDSWVHIIEKEEKT